MERGTKQERELTWLKTHNDDMKTTIQQPDINNHHSIPRESWDNNRNATSPATTTTQEKDAAAAFVNSHG